MDLLLISTHNVSQENAFEAMCNQLFERWLNREFPHENHFVVVNGKGGDGGVESYLELKNGDVIANQVKWFPHRLEAKQIDEIANSIETALKVRPKLIKYIVFLPRDLSNKKIVAKGKIAQETDYSKIKKIENKFKAYKNLSLEFWGTHRITQELNRYENIGTRMFWFNNSIVHFEHLINRFDSAVNGWLNSRYVPNLHQQGFIEEKINQHLFTSIYREKFIIQLKKINGQLFNILNLFLDIANAGLSPVFQAFNSFLVTMTDQIDQIISDIDKGKLQISFIPFYAFDQQTFYGELKQLPVTAKEKTKSLTKQIDQIDLNQLQTSLKDSLSKTFPQYVLFYGPPGTGKTHAFTNFTRGRLEHKYPAILIQAKYSPGDDLSSVLKKALSGFETWSEDELLSGLESLAHSCEILRSTNFPNKNFEPVKVVIAIDGIEETHVSDWEKWSDLVNSLASYTPKYPRIQFILSCRDYFLKSVKLEPGTYSQFYSLPEMGDVPVVKLFSAYSNHYNTPDAPWIKYRLVNQLALRLFCKIYENQRGSTISVETALTVLIKQCLSSIEKEINEYLKVRLIDDEQIILQIVEGIADHFTLKKEVLFEEMITNLLLKVAIERSDLNYIIITFERHGILKKEKYPVAGSMVEEIMYSATHQSFIDFLIAKTLVRQVLKDPFFVIPSHIQQRLGVLQIASDILLNDYQIEVGKNGLWIELDKSVIDAMNITSIGSLPSEQAINYKNKGINDFKRSESSRNEIFLKWILPATQKKDHAFSAYFLHEILSGVPNAFERDLIWSGPDFAGDKSTKRISDFLINYEIDKSEKFDTLPLVFAWSLTSVDNVYRDYAKTQLTLWSHYNNGEFLKLLKLLFGKYDYQLDEDLSLILLGLASIQTSAEDAFKNIALWIDETIFSKIKEKNFYSAVIRHCCRGFQEKAFDLGILSFEARKRARPPYIEDFKYISLDIGKSTGREGERFPIVHDLAWYVIKYSFYHLLEYDSGNQKHKETHQFLEKYRKTTGFSGGPFEFAMSAGVSFIKNIGWNRPDGPGYTSATHGSLSDISTFEEKYTWLAVTYIKGYLADYLPFNDYGSKSILDDYSKFLKIKNPANDVKDEHMFPSVNNKWLIPTNIAPLLSFKAETIQADVERWVDQEQDIDFEKWLEFPDLAYGSDEQQASTWLCLNNYTSLVEPNGYGSTVLQCTPFLIKETEFENFKIELQTNQSLQSEIDPDSLTAHPDVEIYISPIDAIWMKWIKEENTLADWSGFDMKKAISEVLTTEDNHEKTYYLPSKEIRELLKIIQGNGQVFMDDQKTVVSFYNEIGEAYYDQQKILLVKKDILEEALNAMGYRLVWSVFNFQKAEVEKGRKDETYHQSCQLSIVWREKTSYESIMYYKGYHKN